MQFYTNRSHTVNYLFWVLPGNPLNSGGGESHQGCPLPHHSGDDQEGVAPALAGHAEGDGGPHQPRGE